MNKIEEFKRIINESNRIVFFGGAGVSVPSGIPDFRSDDGIYNQGYKINPETILSHTFFFDYTKEFYGFYKSKMIYLNAKPNMAHIKLAQLEQKGKLLSVVTQNIDGLHQKAGSKRVHELHGSTLRNYCEKCHKFYDVNYVLNSNGIPVCECGGLIKPDVVLYEEPLDGLVIDSAIRDIASADTLIIGGTSMTVYPAASLVYYFQGKNLIVINKSTTQADENATLVINESIDKVFEEIE